MDERTSTAHADAEEDEEDSLPDWTQFAKFAKFVCRSLFSIRADEIDRTLGKTSESTAFIPRRGEKDFEPVLRSSLLNSSAEQDTLSTYQLSLLTASRSALFSALSSGSLYHSSKSHNSFTWRPEISRATNDLGTMAYGVHFLTMGKFNPVDKRLELLPEETLYLAERGAIELWKEDIVEGQVMRVAMSVQQAWTEVIGHDDLTLERFQVSPLFLPFESSANQLLE